MLDDRWVHAGPNGHPAGLSAITAGVTILGEFQLHEVPCFGHGVHEGCFAHKARKSAAYLSVYGSHPELLFVGIGPDDFRSRLGLFAVEHDTSEIVMAQQEDSARRENPVTLPQERRLVFDAFEHVLADHPVEFTVLEGQPILIDVEALQPDPAGFDVGAECGMGPFQLFRIGVDPGDALGDLSGATEGTTDPAANVQDARPRGNLREGDQLLVKGFMLVRCVERFHDENPYARKYRVRL